MKISDKVLLRKIGLSEKFPRKMLYNRNSALGVGLIKLSRMVFILVLKFYISYIISQDRILNLIRINEENIIFQNGYNNHILEIPINNLSKATT